MIVTVDYCDGGDDDDVGDDGADCNDGGLGAVYIQIVIDDGLWQLSNK